MVLSRVGAAMLGLFAEIKQAYMLDCTERARTATQERGVAPGPKMKLAAEIIERAVTRRLEAVDVWGRHQDGVLPPPRTAASH